MRKIGSMRSGRLESTSHRAGLPFLRGVWPIPLLALGLMAGCGSPGGNFPVGSYERGEAEFEGGAHLDAIDDLKLFVRRNPQDDLADNAQFLVGRAYMEMEDYPVAAVEFEILRADYPNSEKAAESFYLEGVCWYEQVPDFRLDQTSTERAIELFTRYLSTYPDSEFREQGQEKLDELWLHMDKKRLANVRTYRQLGRPEPAYQVVMNLMEARPNSQLRPDMLLMRGELAYQLEEYDDAARTLNELVQSYPDSDHHKDAKKLLERVDKIRSDDG